MNLHGNRWMLTLAIAGLALLPVWAQQQRGPRGMGMPGHHYDTSAEITLKGTVTELKEVKCPMCGAAMETHLMLKTEAESIAGPDGLSRKERSRDR